MNDRELTAKVQSAIRQQINRRGYIAPVDVMMDIGVLTKQNYNDWRFGKVPFLEKVCTVNLRKLSLIMHEIRSYAVRNGCKESFTYYRKWGNKQTVQLRFSKSGAPDIERAYATHYVDTKRVAALKAEKDKAQ